jgi:hypothetical protein
MADSHWKGMCLAGEREAAGDCLSGDEQIIRPDGRALSFQFRADVRGGFRTRTVERHFNDGGNESLGFSRPTGPDW